MCGRYALPIAPDTLPEWFARQNVPLDNVEYAEKRTEHRYNIGPTAYAPVYMKKGGDNPDSSDIQGRIEYMRWGLVPSWVTKTSDLKKSGYSTFNARFENLTSNRMWKGNLSHRCVVPILGYYEWQQDGKKEGASKNKKTPYYIRRRDGELMFLAGLYHHGKIEEDQDTGKAGTGEKTNRKEGKREDLGSYTIITRDAPKMLKWLHSRMPVVLRPQDEEFTKWLDGEGTNDEDFDKLLKKYEHEEDLEWYPVDPAVGNSRTDSEKYVQPWKKKEPLMGFFKPKQAVKRERSDDDKLDKDTPKDGQQKQKKVKIKEEEDT